MIVIFIVSGIFSLWLLFASFRTYRITKNVHKLMESVDVNFPSVREKDKKISIVDKLKHKILWHFRNIYSTESGLKIKGFLILSFITAGFIIGNAMFLQFNILIAIVLGLFFSGYLTNLLQARSIRIEFEKSFPEALVIISGSISSGNNIIQALQDCADSIEGVLSKELKIIVRSISIGDDPTKVFAQSYKRLPFGIYYFFLTALLVSIKSGARVKEVLSRLSTATTKAKAMEKKKNAITSEARMSSKITAAIPFAFLILMKFISPDNFDYIMNDPQGRYILYYFLGSEGIGMLIVIFLMRKI